jgi:chemosensory pili system protein ChpA (sensor histidine kinase/response regulator)
MSQKPELNRKKVLVVDDDDAIRRMVERVLEREHYVVESARDGFEAIEKLSQNDYATVLLDLMMPRVDGHGVLRFLETERTEMPPVIVMTANVPSAMRMHAAKPVACILPKPFDIGTLVSHVRDCADAQPICARSDE